MNFRPSVAASPNPSSPERHDPGSGKRVLRAAALVLGGGVVALAGASVYALHNPEKMPDSVGAVIEDWTGANPHPVQLVLPPQRPLSALAQLGRELFFDPSLSASGQQSCASCHSPGAAFAQPNDLTVQIGGPHLDLPGYRPPPSLTYLYRQAPFSIGPDQNEIEVPVNLNDMAASATDAPRAQKTAGASAQLQNMVPQGGMFWDGRADTLQIQAIQPMINPFEMGNKDEDAVAAKLEHSRYTEQFKQLFGPYILDRPALLVQEAMSALSRYQVEDNAFHSFTSKYDYWLQGKARLTQTELRGMRLFNDQTKANCAGCHISQPTKDGLPPLFTDTQYEALGVPRNPQIPANKDPKFFDMGICGPLRSDLATQTQYCGMFLTPTLRNTATRHVFFHNGVYHTLKEVMDFYNLRNTHPEKIYPRDASGKVQMFDDLPAQYHANIDYADPPFDRKPTDQPAMSDQDIQDIIAFIGTLTDGYKPAN